MRITTKTDLRNYIDDALGCDATPADIDGVTDAIEAGEHPAWGCDWALYLTKLDLWSFCMGNAVGNAVSAADIKRIGIIMDGVWAGTGNLVNGSIRDCGAQFCDDADESEVIYSLIEDAIAEGKDKLKVELYDGSNHVRKRESPRWRRNSKPALMNSTRWSGVTTNCWMLSEIRSIFCTSLKARITGIRLRN
jgi:hypothetical protein